MSRYGFLLIGTALAAGAMEGDAFASRAIALHFTATERAQIAIWIEKTDGTFMGTVGLTQSVSVRGIGNRPGAAQMNSGYHWPYGRREGVLPIWAHRRAEAPGAMQFPRVTFQSRPEGLASRTCEDSTRDSYFCLSFTAESTRKDGLDAVSCASVFNSDKGRFGGSQSEPMEINGQAMNRPLIGTSLYPPRRDFTSCSAGPGAPPNPCMNGNSACLDHPDSTMFADVSRAVMPEIDAITMATPPAEVEQTVMYSIPDTWPEGDYVAWLEVNTEGDYNSTFNPNTFPTPSSQNDWDTWAINFGYPYRGQPSVVYSVPFNMAASTPVSASVPVGFGSVDGTDPNAGMLHAMDGTITNDPAGTPGSGADRLRISPLGYRLQVEVRGQDFCLNHNPPEAPTAVAAEPSTDPKHSHQWGRLSFVIPASELAIAKYEVRVSTSPIIPGDTTSFIQGLPGEAASTRSEGLMIPVGGAAGTGVQVDFGGMTPSKQFWVGLRAVDVCNRAGPHAVAELTTTAIEYTQLSGCFVATAAWGSALQSSVAAMRSARDRLRADAPWFAVLNDLYRRSAPPAAAALARSETARVLARRLIGPLGTAAEAAASRP